MIIAPIVSTHRLPHCFPNTKTTVRHIGEMPLIFANVPHTLPPEVIVLPLSILEIAKCFLELSGRVGTRIVTNTAWQRRWVT
jgi:hypothetical protein